MSTRTYPYKAWTVLPSGKPVEVELVASAKYWGGSTTVWDRSEKFKKYDSTKLYATKTLALITALEKLDATEEKLRRQLDRIAKKREILEKARAES